MEKVLVFPASVMEQLGYIHGVLTDAAKLQKYCDAIFANAFFTERSSAEHDKTVKQIIPYVVLRRGKQIWGYQRGKAGGEARLHNKWSLGIGGHIDEPDAESSADVPGSFDAKMAYKLGLMREVHEEVGLLVSVIPAAVAAVYDSGSDVGQVHFGLVHVLDIPISETIRSTDAALLNGQWFNSDVLLRNASELESWARLVAEANIAAI